MSRLPISLWLIASALLLSQPAKADQITPPESGRHLSVHDGASRGDRTDAEERGSSKVEILNERAPVSQTRTEKGSVFRVGAVQIETQASVNQAIFQQVIEPFLGSQVTERDLARLAQQIADVARANGMLLVDAYVPNQRIEMGIVKVVLSVGAIDEVRIEGSSNRALRRLLAPLVGTTTMKRELERRLILANTIPQIYVRNTEIIYEGKRRILLVRVEKQKKISGQLVLDNYGSKEIGPLRARLSVDTVALFDSSDSLNVTLRSNPTDPAELLVASAVYGLALGNNGTRLEVAAAGSDSGIDPRFGFTRRDGKSAYGSLSISHPIKRSVKENLWLDGQFEYLKVRQAASGSPLQDDTIVTVSAGLSSSHKLGGGWLRVGTQIRQGLGILNANKPGNLLSSRQDANGTFRIGRAWANWSGKPVGDLTLRVAVSGQIASEPLLSSEEIGIGGPYIGRAFEFYERSGDSGIVGLAEIGYEFDLASKGVKRIQPYAFVDGGHVRNLRGGYGGGSVASAGGGVRMDAGRFAFQFEAALPVRESGTYGKKSSPKFNFQIALKF